MTQFNTRYRYFCQSLKIDRFIVISRAMVRGDVLREAEPRNCNVLATNARSRGGGLLCGRHPFVSYMPSLNSQRIWDECNKNGVNCIVNSNKICTVLLH